MHGARPSDSSAYSQYLDAVDLSQLQCIWESVRRKGCRSTEGRRQCDGTSCHAYRRHPCRSKSD
jgi:hypothetical protein